MCELRAKAAHRSSLSLIRLISVLKFETEESGPVLITTARYGYSECVRLLLARPELNPHVVGCGGYGDTPLQIACRNATRVKQDEYAAIVRMLLAHERAIPASVIPERLIQSVSCSCPRVALALLSCTELFSIKGYDWLRQYYQRKDSYPSLTS